VEVTITEAGLKLLDEMQEAIDEFESLLDNLSEEETRQLNALLDKIREGKVENHELLKAEATLQ
jgi:DNA-binding MarR family transcriptional regulator